MRLFSIPEDLIFSPCKVDGHFWKNFHVLVSYLGNPEGLVELKNTDKEKYTEVIEPFIRFVSETEKELHSKGFLEEVEIPE